MAETLFLNQLLHNQEALMKTSQQQHGHLTLAQYVRRRTGVPLGASGSLRNMLHRSLGAGH
jgi:hypothetical protein